MKAASILMAAGLVLLVLIIILAAKPSSATKPSSASKAETYSVGYQIYPHLLSQKYGTSWSGQPYAVSDCGKKAGEGFSSGPGSGHWGCSDCLSQLSCPGQPAAEDGAAVAVQDLPPPRLVYSYPLTRNLRGDWPDWWTKQNGTYGLPPACERPESGIALFGEPTRAPGENTLTADDLDGTALSTAAAAEVFADGDETIHTYKARNPIPPLCPARAVAEHRRRPTAEEEVKRWRYYGGARGWTMSPYY